MKTINIPLNNKLDFNILKKNKLNFLIIFNDSLFVKYTFSNDALIHIIQHFNYINIKLSFFSEYNNIQSFLENTSSAINVYSSKKVIFSGKGYKLKKFNKTLQNLKHDLISFYFNTSHINIMYFFNILVKKIKKTKLILRSVNNKMLTNIIKSILNIRHFNVFTQKGLRFSRQLIYKKIGKKSS
jgi:hypothetical protein